MPCLLLTKKVNYVKITIGMFLFSSYDAVVITNEEQITYLTGFTSSDGYLLITKEHKFYVTDLRYFSACEKALSGTEYKAVIGGNSDFLADYLKQCGVKRLGVDFTAVSLAYSKQLKKVCSSLVDISSEIASIMEIKKEAEIEKIRRASVITQKTYEDILPLLVEGVTEKQIQAEIIYRFLSYGASGVAFEPIVAFGANSAVPHHSSKDTKLEKNQAILIDMGCIVEGYCSDFTRTVFFGNPPQEFIRAYNAVGEAFDSAFFGIKEDMNCMEADALARAVLDREGLEFKHSLGHGVGVEIHEKPYLSARSKDKIKNGSVFTIEPGAYCDGEFGIRTEDTVYMQDGKLQSFYTASKRLKIL